MRKYYDKSHTHYLRHLPEQNSVDLAEPGVDQFKSFSVAIEKLPDKLLITITVRF